MADRRNAIALLFAAALALLAGGPAGASEGGELSREMITHDPAAPVSGNASGDVTIVAFLDYNCGFCKRSAPALDRIVHDDGRIRLVYKDWPILAKSSIYGAKLALAAKYQGKYDVAHRALMGLVGGDVPVDKMTAALTGAGLDMTRLTADAAAHNAEITALITRNNAQARGMLFQGTPVYLIGPLKVAAPLDYVGFRDAVAQARARAKLR